MSETDHLLQERKEVIDKTNKKIKINFSWKVKVCFLHSERAHTVCKWSLSETRKITVVQRRSQSEAGRPDSFNQSTFLRNTEF